MRPRSVSLAVSPQHAPAFAAAARAKTAEDGSLEVTNLRESLENEAYLRRVAQMQIDIQKRARQRDAAQHQRRLEELQEALAAAEQARERMVLENEALRERVAELDGADAQVRALEAELAVLRPASPSEERPDYQALFEREREERRKLHNTLLELRGNIRVHCRVRPLLGFDVAHDQRSTIQVADEERLLFQGRADGSRRAKEFQFDHVYGPKSTQHDVFADVEPLVVSALDGFNVLVMAFGQTGSGKTHTMTGGAPEAAQGIIPRTLEALFQVSAQQRTHRRMVIDLSIVEIYNNEFRDLMQPESPPQQHELRTANGLAKLTGVRYARVHTAAQIRQWLDVANNTRAEGTTSLNEHSSRSHLIVTLFITVTNMATREQTESKLSLVDMAGSENVGLSQAKGDTLREASYINRSICALGDVLGALAQKKKHIPYRNSRLTHYLQDSIGGDAKMVLLITVTPSTAYISESMYTLYFGERAAQVQRGQSTRQVVFRGGSSRSPTSDKRRSVSMVLDHL